MARASFAIDTLVYTRIFVHEKMYIEEKKNDLTGGKDMKILLNIYSL
jgi:hypothetical protein